nr:stem-specific protein TSJT1-like [Ipomoea trifida]
MLAVFEQCIGKAPPELNVAAEGQRRECNSREEIAESFRSRWQDSTLYKLANDNFLGLSHGGESPKHPRSIVVMEDIFCIFSGALDNICDLRKYYGLSRQATEAMIMVEAYKVLRDRAPYPPDQVIKELEGKFSFILFDSKTSTLFLARDREGSVALHWGVGADESLVCSDDPDLINAACGQCYTPFPPGCIFISGSGLTSFDHPLHKVKAMVREDDGGKIEAVIFQVDFYTRLHSIPRRGSASNWADAAVVEGD